MGIIAKIKDIWYGYFLGGWEEEKNRKYWEKVREYNKSYHEKMKNVKPTPYTGKDFFSDYDSSHEMPVQRRCDNQHFDDDVDYFYDSNCNVPFSRQGNYIYEGMGCNGKIKYCICDGFVYEGMVPNGNALFYISGNYIYEGAGCNGKIKYCICDGFVYEGMVPNGKALFIIR